MLSVAAFLIVCALILVGLIFLIQAEETITATYKNAGIYGRFRATLLAFTSLCILSVFIKPLYGGIIGTFIFVVVLPICMIASLILFLNPAMNLTIAQILSGMGATAEEIISSTSNASGNFSGIGSLSSLAPFDLKNRILTFVLCVLLAVLLYMPVHKRCPASMSQFLYLKMALSGVCAIPRLMIMILIYTVAIILGILNLFALLCVIVAEIIMTFMMLSILAEIFSSRR